MKDKSFMNEVIIKTALPITLQSLFQASFSVIDQLMTGQLGTVNVAAVGLCGKFSSLFSVVAAAVATAAGIMLSQYIGSRDEEGVSRSFTLNLILSGGIALSFTLLSLLLPYGVIGIYSKDVSTIGAGASCLRILAVGFIPMAASLMVSTLLRCEGYAKLPLYASVTSAAMNTGLNYVMIFGKAGCPAMGIIGASWATTFSRIAECVLLLIFLVRMLRRKTFRLQLSVRGDKAFKKTFAAILVPILLCEFLWSLGENVYAVVYGRIGTAACAAMTLTNPIQSLMIGALTGIASAAGIYIGRLQGKGEDERAYEEAQKFIRYGLGASAALSIILLAADGLYVKIYNVDEQVKDLTRCILIAYAVIAPVKVENMIIGGGIIRSGGKTKYVTMIDFIGTWGVGVPLALLTGLVIHLPIYWVYFLLSLEECVRLAISIVIFRKRLWINKLTQRHMNEVQCIS